MRWPVGPRVDPGNGNNPAAAALLHPWNRALDRSEKTRDRNGERLVDVVRLDLQERLKGRGRSVCNEDVDAPGPVRPLDPVEECIDRRGLAHVELAHVAAAPGRLDLLRDGLRLFRLAVVGHDRHGAQAGQANRRFPAEAARASRHQCDPALKIRP